MNDNDDIEINVAHLHTAAAFCFRDNLRDVHTKHQWLKNFRIQYPSSYEIADSVPCYSFRTRNLARELNNKAMELKESMQEDYDSYSKEVKRLRKCYNKQEKNNS